jgi:hypothetical protein
MSARLIQPRPQLPQRKVRRYTPQEIEAYRLQLEIAALVASEKKWEAEVREQLGITNCESQISNPTNEP